MREASEWLMSRLEIAAVKFSSSYTKNNIRKRKETKWDTLDNVVTDPSTMRLNK